MIASVIMNKMSGVGSIGFILKEISNLKASITLHRPQYLYDIEIKKTR